MAYEPEKYKKSQAVKDAEAKASKYDTYTEGESVSAALAKKNDYETNNKVAEWNGGTYGDAVKNAWEALNNREKFSYDLNGDALYQQYKDKYINQGRLAMADTIGQASAMTGGYGSSYAVTAGNQAYQSHLQNLNDIVPQLYEMAYNRYTQEGNDLKDKYTIANNMYQTEYGEHRDKVSDYNTQLDRLINEYNNERNYDYGKWSADRTHYTTVANNERTFDYGQYRDSVSDSQWQASYDLQKASFDLQSAAAQTENFKGLTFEDSAKLAELRDNEDWDGINRYIASMSLSNEDYMKLAKIWLPDDYLNPPTKSPNYEPKKSKWSPMHTLN